MLLLLPFFFCLNCIAIKGQSNSAYDTFLGNYELSNEHWLTVSRSQTRPYIFDNKTLDFRGMKAVNDSVFTVGQTIISETVAQTYRFYPDFLEIETANEPLQRAYKKELYKTKEVVYRNHAGIQLGGTLFLPRKPNGIGFVWVHGSGAQDRNGYASLIRLFADYLVRAGFTVLTYDKQGVGKSAGNWERLSFKDLAGDALAGMAYLKQQTDVPLQKIGLAGSSQAGWVVAKAIEQNKKTIDYVLLIGAAGSGISVLDQNYFNTQIQMKCTRQFSPVQISNALHQQKAFFDYILKKNDGRVSDSLTKVFRQDSALRNWLFPMRSEVDWTNKNQWYTALEVDFDPLSIWGSFDRPTLMIFSEFDDSTPTDMVVSKLKKLKNKHLKTVIIPNAQHIGLKTDGICKGDVAELQQFHPQFFKEIMEWLSSIKN